MYKTLKTEAKDNERGDESRNEREKHCTFHDRNGHA